MTTERRPPRLLVKTLAVTFLTVIALLVIVFVVVMLTVRRQVRDAVTANLASSQRMFAALETRRQRELIAQAATVAESPTLKAALDTYQAELRTSSTAIRAQLFSTIDDELKKVAARIDSDALVVVDMRRTILASAGRLGDRWPRGRPVAFTPNTEGNTFDGIARMGGAPFRIVAVPLQLESTTIGTLFLATSLDQNYAEELAGLAGTRTAIISDGLLVASTLSAQAARQFESAVAVTRPVDGIAILDGESHAFRRLVAVGDTVFYALGSIDESSRSATREAMAQVGVSVVWARRWW